MLTLDVSQIPPEGMDVDSPLEAGEVHLEGERSFDLQPGGSLRCHVERGDDQELLNELTRLAAEIESELASSQSRYGATRAYHELVTTRIAELREDRDALIEAARAVAALASALDPDEREEAEGELRDLGTSLGTDEVERVFAR